MSSAKKPIYKRTWFIVIMVIIVIGAIASPKDSDNSSGNQQPQETQKEELAKSSEEETTVTETTKKEPVLEVTAGDLVDALNNNALKAADTYKDKYIRVTGKVANIDSNGKYFTIDPIDSTFNLTNVMCNITKEQKEIVADFSKGQEVTVEGKVTLVGEVLGYSIDVELIE